MTVFSLPSMLKPKRGGGRKYVFVPRSPRSKSPMSNLQTQPPGSRVIVPYIDGRLTTEDKMKRFSSYRNGRWTHSLPTSRREARKQKESRWLTKTTCWRSNERKKKWMLKLPIDRKLKWRILKKYWSLGQEEDPKP